MVAMRISIATNTELSSRFFASKLNPTNNVLLNCAYECKLPFRSMASRRVSVNSCVLSMSGSGSTTSGGLTYKDAGVDIDAGSELVRRIAKMAPGIGGFGGLFPLGNNIILFIYLII